MCETWGTRLSCIRARQAVDTPEGAITVANWMAVTADEFLFQDVSGAEMYDGVIRYVIQRKDDGSFGSIEIGGRKFYPKSSMVYVQGNTLHVHVE